MPEKQYKIGRHTINEPSDSELFVLNGWHRSFNGKEFGLSGTFDSESTAKSKAHSLNNQGFTTRVVSFSDSGKTKYALYATKS